MVDIKFNNALIKKIEKNIKQEIYTTYDNGFKELTELSTLLSANLTSRQNLSLRNYYVIRLIGILETILKNSFINLIDQYGCDFKTTITTDLKGLRQLRTRSKKFTSGEIVANSLGFQRFETRIKSESSIYTIFGDIFDVDFFGEMASNKSDFIKIHENIVDTVNERHRIIHDLQDTVYTHDMLTESTKSVKKFLNNFLDTRNTIMNKWNYDKQGHKI